MNNELKHLRNRFSSIATLLVFLFTLFVWAGFISYRYYVWYESTVHSFDIYKQSVRTIDINNFKGWISREDSQFASLYKKSFILVWWDGNVIENNSPYTDRGEISGIFHHLHENDVTEDDGYLISTFRMSPEYLLIIIDKLPYNLIDYLEDIWYLTLLILILSGGVFYIAFKSSSYLLRPIEENMETMRYFVQVAGHELRTPLAGISSSVQLLKEIGKYDEEIVSDIKNQTNRSSELIQSLSELSDIRKDGIQNEEVHISEIVYETMKDIENMIKNHNIKLSIDLKEDITLHASKHHIYILIMNLLSNAIKYNKEWWMVKIIIENNKLSIEDSGIGIEKKYISKIFDQFYRVSTHRNETEWFGLGLALVKRIVNQYGWKINVKSSEEGTVFRVTF